MLNVVFIHKYLLYNFCTQTQSMLSCSNKHTKLHQKFIVLSFHLVNYLQSCNAHKPVW